MYAWTCLDLGKFRIRFSSSQSAEGNLERDLERICSETFASPSEASDDDATLWRVSSACVRISESSSGTELRRSDVESGGSRTPRKGFSVHRSSFSSPSRMKRMQRFFRLKDNEIIRHRTANSYNVHGFYSFTG